LKMTKSVKTMVGVGIGVVCLILFLCIGSFFNKEKKGAKSKELESNVNIGTHAVGGAYYAMGTGVAKIVSENTPIKATVLPYAGPDAWIPEMRDGVINLGIISGVDLSWAYRGEVVYEEPTPEIRLVLNGNQVNHCTFTVLEKSGFNSISDLKGKKVGYGYGGNKFTVHLVDAALASVGLSIDDCEKIPLTDLATSQRALQERRVDAIFSGSPTTPSSVQLDQSIGLRILPFGDLKPSDLADGVPEKMQAILDKYVPGATLSVCPVGGTVKEETVLISYPIDLVASANLSEEAVYQIMGAIEKKYPDLKAANAWGAGWIPENFAIHNQPAPYHDGSIKFFKEKGTWTEQMQARQDQLLGK
jgi:TRAP transporter TAXI family solute receptor